MPVSYEPKTREHTLKEKYCRYEESVVLVVPSGSVIGTDCRRSSRGMDFADSPSRAIPNTNQHQYDSVLRSRKEHMTQAT